MAAVAALLCVVSARAPAVEGKGGARPSTAALPQATRQFQNPIIRGFAPDPSIVRAGQDFYLVTSSFEYWPAIPVYHSQDLVHWELISHALAGTALPGLEQVESSGGVQAATIREHQGVFYVVATAVIDGRAVSFIVTARDPRGPWSEPRVVKDAEGIDPALFFDDDGRIWYVANRIPPDPAFAGQTEIWLQELDESSLQLKGPRVALWRGCCQGEWAEGPRLFKHAGQYVLLIAEGGTSYEHAVSVAVARAITGPYRNDPRNPVLTHRQLSYDAPITSVGHADLVELADGRWYAVALGTRRLEGLHPILGRETFLLPVVWEQEREWWKQEKAVFPVFSPATGRVESRYTMPFAGHAPSPREPFLDSFTGTQLDPQWITRRPGHDPFVRLNRPGTLQLELRPDAIAERGRYSFIGIRQRHFRFDASVVMRFMPQHSEEAGLLVVQKDTAAFGCLLRRATSGQRELIVMRVSAHGREDLAAQQVPAGALHLRVSGKDLDYRCQYSRDGQRFQSVGPRLDGRALSPAVLPGFNYTGVVLGLYGSSNGEPTSAVAEFSQFEYRPDEIHASE